MRTSVRPAIVLITVALLTGCTSSDGDDADTSPGPTRSAEETEAVDDALEQLGDAAGPDAEPVPLEKELPVLATRTTTDGSIPLEVELNSVRATGQVMTVVFTARNTGTERWQISDFFDDGSGYPPLDADGNRPERTPGGSDTRLAWSTDGVTVLDPVNGLVHRAAYDTAGNCACNIDLGNRHVGAGESIVLTTAFAAPPEDVTQVTVQIPGAGSFDGVPLNR